MKKIIVLLAAFCILASTGTAQGKCVNGASYVLKGYFEDSNNNAVTGKTLTDVKFDVFYDDGTSSTNNSATAELGQGWYRYAYTSNGKSGIWAVRDATTVIKNFPGGLLESLCDSQDPAATVAAVWGEPQSGYSTAGTFGKYLDSEVSGAGGDPWATALPGAYGAGTAGKIVGDNVNATISSRQASGAVDLNADQSGVTIGTVSTVTGGATASALATAQADLDNPSQYMADVSGVATAAALTTHDGKLDTVDANVDAVLVDTGTTLEAHLTGIKGATFSGTTDSLEAIRDRGDAAWTTGAGGSAPTVEQIRTEMDANSTQLAAIVADTNELQTNQGNWATATGFSTHTAADAADAVWDEAIAGHLGAGSTGLALNSASSAGDPWNTAIPGAYGAGTAGKIVGDNINATISSRASSSDLATHDGKLDTVDANVDAVLADTGTDGVVVATASKTGYALSTAGVDAILDEAVEGSYTMRQILCAQAAVLFGKASGGGTTTITFRNLGDTLNRVSETVDSNGNRTGVTLTLTGCP